MDNEQDVLKSKVTAELINETKIALNNHEHFNKEDKKVSQGKQVNTETLSISKKGRSSKSEADIKVKKNKKTKI